ncbi:MAG: hypothetical protein R3Y35_13490 [Clostridia bacterium]
MKKIVFKNNILERTINTKYIILLLPIFVIIGKVVRWTIMVDTLINQSKGWGYVNVIIGDVDIPFVLFSAEDALAGEYGGTNNMYLLYRVFWNLCLRIPNDFYSFEIALTLLFTFILFLLFCKLKPNLLVSEFIFISLAVIVLSVYCFSLAKEPMQMIYFLLLFLVIYTDKIPDNKKLIAAIAVILFSAATFRVYYVIFLIFGGVFFLVIKLFKKEKLTNWNIVLIFLFMVVTYFVMLSILYVALPSLYHRLADSLLYASVATSSSNTYMENIITQSKTNVLIVALEYGLASLRMLFPFELVTLGVKYWPYIIYQLCMTFMFIKSLKTFNTNSKIQNIALIVFVGFVFGSATFEVDFGAWIRHGAVTLPVMLLMLGNIKEKILPSEVEK